MTRPDADAKLRGLHRYPTDHPEAGMLFLRAARSKIAHGRIERVDTKAALEVPGVEMVLVADDVPGVNAFGLLVFDQPVLCGEYVRRVGDPIALVAATSDRSARMGAEAVQATITPLPVVGSVEEALAPGACPVQPDGNLCATVELQEGGDVDAIFAAADIVHESRYETPRQSHLFLETEGGVAYLDGEVVTVVAGGQNPLADQQQIALVLGIGTERVRVLNVATGGAFGGKEDASVQPLLALATWCTRRPCRYTYDRSESLVAGTKRHPFSVRYRSAADRSGRLLALDVDFVADAGPYTALSPAVVALAAEHAAGGYDIPTTRVRGRAVFTNNAVASAMRGFGNPQVIIGLEQHLDLVAQSCRIDPIVLRRANVPGRGCAGGSAHTVQTDSGSLERVLDSAAELAARCRGTGTDDRRAGWLHGHGGALVVQGYGLGVRVEEGASVGAALEPGGKIVISVSTPDMGTGVHGSLAMLAAAELNVAPNDVVVRTGDSLFPSSGSANASRGLFIMGNAVVDAARLLAGHIRQAVSGLTGSPPAQVLLSPGQAVVGTRRLPFDLIAELAGPIRVIGEFRPTVRGRPLGKENSHYGYTAGYLHVELDVDALTGRIELTALHALVDAGRVVNPEAARSQIEGGIVQGIGFCLYEDACYDDGMPANDRLATYVIPTALDVPVGSLVVEFLSGCAETNPLGVRGLGELGVTPVAPAIANALAAATGHRFSRFPVRAEDILNALAGTARARSEESPGKVMKPRHVRTSREPTS